MIKPMKTIVVAVMTLGLIAVLGQASASPQADMEAAQRRLKNALQQVNPPEVSVPDVRQDIKLPEVETVPHRVPNFSMKPHVATPKVDPMAVAKRYQQSLPPEAKTQSDLMVFVSFSMPATSLRRIAAETARTGGVMVIRGFKDDSLKATVAATQELAALGGELLIHPELFDRYQIHEVPTFVLASGETPEVDCAGNTASGYCQEHYQVKGDVSLHAALDYFGRLKANPTLSAVALSKLERLEGQP